jgi:peptide-methionine (S)-S-oxide reductase
VGLFANLFGLIAAAHALLPRSDVWAILERCRTMEDAELDGLFQHAVAAIDAGDVPTLERLLAQHPRLVRERLESPGPWLRDQIGPALDGFFNRPYLLWFVTEDAVRTGRLSANVADIARVIIQAAKRTGVDDLQNQLDSTLHFAVCSPIGWDDGRQLELIDVLIDAGALMDGAPVQALICCNTAAAEHVLRRGARLTLPAAVCLERWDDLNRLAREASATEKQVALGLAALNGKAEGLARLLPFGVDLDAFTSEFYSHATPLHHAVWSGRLDAVKVLVEAGAKLDTKDTAEDATPLGWAEYADSSPKASVEGKQFREIAAYLRAKGAR